MQLTGELTGEYQRCRSQALTPEVVAELSELVGAIETISNELAARKSHADQARVAEPGVQASPKAEEVAPVALAGAPEGAPLTAPPVATPSPELAPLATRGRGGSDDQTPPEPPSGPTGGSAAPDTPTPPPTPPPQSWWRRRVVVLSAVALIVVAGVGIGIAVSGGGGGSRTTTSTTTAQDVAEAHKECALVNPADIQAAFGSAGPGVPDPSGPAPDCTFTAGATNLSVFIDQEGASQADFNNSRQTAGSGAQDVPGLGGGAYITSGSTGDTLTVFDTKRAIVFSLYGDQNTKQQLIDLARLMLARA